MATEPLPTGKGNIPKAFATLEQIASDEAFRIHFPPIKVQLINALMITMMTEAHGVTDMAELGRVTKVYDRFLRVLDDLGRYSTTLEGAKKKAFPRLKDPTHT